MLDVRKSLGWPRKDFARLISVSARRIADIETGVKPTTAILRKYKETTRIIDALSEIVEPDFIGDWMKEPNEAFDGLKPLEVIERGESDRIWRMIYYLRSGMPM